jgi:cycloeucalenol cycloisomerase
MYDRFDEWGYLAVGLAGAVPCVALPLLSPAPADAGRPLAHRHWVKASAYIATFSFIGNWFWTHYFYELLGASYTMRAHDWNRVPVAMYLLTHAYFCFYHALGNVVQRAARRAAVSWAGAGPRGAACAQAVAVVALSYVTAYGETLTIAHFPHYAFTDRARMYSVGSLFYALYFIVSFPWFLSLDEEEEGGGKEGKENGGGRKATVASATAAALGAGMVVTTLLDLWRVAYGGIAPPGGGGRIVPGKGSGSGGALWGGGRGQAAVARWARLPWMVGSGGGR